MGLCFPEPCARIIKGGFEPPGGSSGSISSPYKTASPLGNDRVVNRNSSFVHVSHCPPAGLPRSDPSIQATGELFSDAYPLRPSSMVYQVPAGAVSATGVIAAKLPSGDR